MSNIKLTALALTALALLLAGCEREITGDVKLADNSDENCFQCHSGLLDQAQGEWVNSIHASGNNVDYTNRGGSDCTMCHDQQGFIMFQETGTLPDDPFETVSAIGCFTCHDPHETGNFNLRAIAAVTLKNDATFDHGKANLCVACHHSRRSADDITDNQSVNRYWGPHRSPQGDVIQGTNGWEFPGLSYNFPSSPHATQVQDACAGCHMGNVRTHEGYDIGGHSFNMRGLEDTTLILAGICSDGSCHPTAKKFDFIGTDSIDYDNDGVVEGYQTEVEGLMDTLRTLLVAQGVLDGTDHPVSGTIADKHLAGSLYNFLTVLEDRSDGVHNFNYTRSLLEASIDYVYNLDSSAPPKRLATLSNH